MTYKEHFEKFLAENNCEEALGNFLDEYQVCGIYDIRCDSCEHTKECPGYVEASIKWDMEYEPRYYINNWVEDELGISDIPVTNVSSLINFESKDEQLLINNPNPVTHPLHYNAHNIEVIDFIQDWELNFALGNAIKYICRSPYKGKQIEDIQKAIQYLEFELEDLLKKENKNK